MVIGMNNIQNYVEAVLQQKLQGDGGWIAVSYTHLTLPTN